MNTQLEPVNQVNLRGLFITATVYCLLVAYNLIHLLHVTHIVDNRALLPLVPIDLGIKAIFFDLFFICIHIVVGFLLAFPIWLPLITKIRSNRKLSKVINWFCIIALLLFVPLNNYVLCLINSNAQFNTHFFSLFIPMMAVTIFALYKLIKFEFSQK